MRHTTRTTWEAHEATILESLRELRRLADTPAPASPDERDETVIDVVRGTEGVWQAWWMYADLHDTTEICAIVPDLQPLLDSLSPRAADDYAEVLGLLRSRRLRFRLVLPTEARLHDDAAHVVHQLVEHGVEVRLAETSRWFFVSRGRTCVLPAVWGDPGATDVFVMRSEPVAGALTDLFEHRWAAARPWHTAEKPDDAVLSLLAEGHEDEAVAAALGISVRTVRRRVADAMTAYGASTRFALGAAYRSGPPRPPG